MRMQGLPTLVVAAILLTVVLAPAMGLMNNSNSSFNLNESLNGTTNPDPETPCPSSSIEDTANGTDTEANQTETMNESVDVVYDSTPKPVIIMFKDESDAALVKQHGGKIKSAYQLKPALAASLPQNAIDNLRKNPGIEFIVDDLQISTMGETLDWGVDRIDADVVHEYNKGTGVKVAIMDTGIDYNHPDLAANYKGGYDFGGDYSGAPNDADPMDCSGHGTHCAGIAAAVRENEIGVIGVAPEADLYAVKVFTDDGYGSYSDVVEALEWCIDTRTDADPDNDIQVISMSFGSKYSAGDPGIESWINAAYDAGIVLVGAAGNEGNVAGLGDNAIYPARYESVIAVAATGSSDGRASFSSTGLAVELAAPGVSIYSTYLGGVYAAMSGTSMACPHVTGTVALVWNAYPDYTNTEVRQRLQATVEDLGAPGKDNKFGYGLVDAEKAAVDTIDTIPPASVDDLQPSAVGGTWINWTWNDPADADLSHVMLHLNGIHKTNVSKGLGFYNVNSLEPDTSYEIGAQTVDTAGNINETWMNQTVETNGEGGFLPQGAGDPTVNATANAKGTNDNTGDILSDLQADDVSGASPSGVTTGDGWYTIDRGDIMFIDGFNTTGISGTITGVFLNVQYSVEDGYSGSNPVQWALDAGTLTTTGITPANGEVDKVATYNLYAQGVDTVDEISTLDVEFRSNDGGGPTAVSFDYVFVTVTQDAQAPQWSDAQKNKTTIYQNNYVKFTANWTDDIDLAGYIFSINQTGTWVNSSFTPFSGTSNTSENTTQITATAGTTVEWRFYANDTSDNGNVTDIQSFVVSSPAPPPSSPYMIYGWVFYENQTACNNPVVNITNLNSSTLWQAETKASYNYYQIMLANGTDLNVSEILQFNVKAPDGSQVNTTFHTVTQAEINNGSLFDFNITLEAPVTPFMIYGWVNYNNGTASNNPTVNITNTNTSTQWQAETNNSYNYYQLLLDTTKISAGDVLKFNASDGTEHNSTNHTVTAGDINNGSIFDFNLTLPSASSTDGPTVDSITITPDDDNITSGVQVNPNPGGAKTVTVTVVVSDPNGCGDISTVNITNIAPDPAHGDPSPVTLVNQSGTGTTATYNGTFDMQFYDLPDEYTVTVTAKDTSGSSDTNSSTFNYIGCTAMSLDSGTIAFESIDPGENNTVTGDVDMGTTSSPTIRNIGNVVIDVNITGSNMTSGSDTITKDNIDAQVDTLGYSNLSVARCFDANMAAGASSLEKVDFRLNVPYGTPVGSYNGSVTLTVDTCG